MPIKSGQRTTSDLIPYCLQSCDSAGAIIIALLREQIPAFRQSQSDADGWLVPTVNVIYAFSAALASGEGINLVSTSSFLVQDLGSNICSLSYSHLRKSSLLASAFFFRSVSSVVPLRRLFSDITAFQAAKDVSTSRDKLVEPFNQTEYFFRRLDLRFILGSH